MSLDDERVEPIISHTASDSLNSAEQSLEIIGNEYVISQENGLFIARSAAPLVQPRADASVQPHGLNRAQRRAIPKKLKQIKSPRRKHQRKRG